MQSFEIEPSTPKISQKKPADFASSQKEEENVPSVSEAVPEEVKKLAAADKIVKYLIIAGLCICLALVIINYDYILPKLQQLLKWVIRFLLHF